MNNPHRFSMYKLVFVYPSNCISSLLFNIICFVRWIYLFPRLLFMLYLHFMYRSLWNQRKSLWLMKWNSETILTINLCLFQCIKHIFIFIFIREKRSEIHLVRQRTARKVRFSDEHGKALDQVGFVVSLLSE